MFVFCIYLLFYKTVQIFVLLLFIYLFSEFSELPSPYLLLSGWRDFSADFLYILGFELEAFVGAFPRPKWKGIADGLKAVACLSSK